MHDNTGISKEIKLLNDFKKNGDLAILGSLYKPYMHLVYGVCLKYLKSQTLAQDAVMNIFEELIVKIPKHEIQNFKSWLYVLAKNHCLMALRKENKKNTYSIEESAVYFMESYDNQHPDYEDKFILEDNLDRLEGCIKKLKEEQKECVKLFFLEQKSYQEIEGITAFELKKVKSYIQNGKRNLKICMEDGE